MFSGKQKKVFDTAKFIAEIFSKPTKTTSNYILQRNIIMTRKHYLFAFLHQSAAVFSDGLRISRVFPTA
ncbi:hypothetical protein BG910_03185 [Neisseria chenwenguii]|uniref:Uncharacterized protein n=1 Tax=Neisseria chenwenguii TaxID=1853278 RepID=A0A220S075_9NEIS|nr:hypothetical protein BG910_03185 [Neisseria chenwenguii]